MTLCVNTQTRWCASWNTFSYREGGQLGSFILSFDNVSCDDALRGWFCSTFRTADILLLLLLLLFMLFCIRHIYCNWHARLYYTIRRIYTYDIISYQDLATGITYVEYRIVVVVVVLTLTL